MLAVHCWPLDPRPPWCHAVLLHSVGSCYSVGNVVFPYFFFPLLPGFYPDNYKELCFNCQNHDTFPVSSSLPDFRWAVKAFGLDPESCASPQFRNDGYIFLTNTNCLFAAHPITRNTIKYHKATAAIISGHRVLRSKGALDIVSCIRHVISALGYLHTN